MNQAFNTAWIGFGWGQDVRVDGGAPADAFTVTVHRARPGGGSFAWTGAPDPDGTLRVRIDGKDTATWTAGVLPVSIRIQRGEASGIVADLPPLVVKMPAVPADGSEPLISDRGKPLALQLTGSGGGQIAVRLDAGMKGDKGDKGDTGDLTPELVAACDLAVASAVSASTDALATAGDRAATASDRAQVREDQIEVADDRTRTAADRFATAADRAQTGQDRTAVVGLRAETETLRDSASGHRAAAQAASTASQSNRDATAADRVHTGQDRAAAAASALSTAQDADQTAADRVQTGQDRQAAAASAAAAATFDPALFAKLVGANFAGPVSTTHALRAFEGVRWGASVVPSENNWNAVTSGGVYMAQNMANAPGGSTTWFYVIVQRHDDNHVSQTATNLFSGETFQRIRVGGTWGAWANLWSGATSPVATDAEADAGSVVAPRMWSPAGLWRAARAALPLVTQALAEAGTDTVARSWSVQRVWQAIRAALPLFSQAQAEAGTASTAGAWSPQRDAQAIAAIAPKGSAFLAGIASRTITAGAAAVLMGPASFTATGAATEGAANLAMEGGTFTIVRTRIKIYRPGGVLIYTSGDINVSHQAGALDRVTSPFALGGLTKGLVYDVYIEVSSDSANVIVYPVISGMSA